MNMINCGICGTNTPHTNKHRFVRLPENESINDYLLMFFKTPFIYKRKGKLVKENEFHYLLFPPGTSAEHGSYKTGFVNDWIFFRGELAENIIKKFNLPLSSTFRIDNHSIIERYIDKINLEIKYKNTCYEEEISATITDMLINLGRKFEYTGKNVHPAFEAINNARIYLLNHVEENISIQEVAARSQYSISRFCVLYSTFFSVTPIEDLLNARIEKAISLLKYNHTSVTETAELCGFSSLHYFSRKFKEITGVPPSFYLK